jgi:hypothetical protein
MYKWYTSCILNFIEKHDQQFHIIERNQRGALKNSWGAQDNLLIDKLVLEDAKVHKRTLCQAWIDYQKAYDSIGHEWIQEVLSLYRFPLHLQHAILRLMKHWKTRFLIPNGQRTIITDWIHYKKGIFQGDSLCPKLFCLCLNPMGEQLASMAGYRFGVRENESISIPRKVTHLYYIDDLKVFAESKVQLQMTMLKVQEITDDIGMTMGLEKCNWHLRDPDGKIDNEPLPLDHGVIIQALPPDKSYKFLGIDEAGEIDKETVLEKAQKEFNHRIDLIWNSQLHSAFKIRATNTFAVPKLTYLMVALRLTCEESNGIDEKLRSALQKKFHACYTAQSTAAWFLDRKNGGRGLTSIHAHYCSTRIKIMGHLCLSEEPLLKELAKIEMGKGEYSIYSDATKFAADIGITLEIDEQFHISANGIPIKSTKQLGNIIHQYQQSQLQQKFNDLKFHGNFQKTLALNLKDDLDVAKSSYWLTKWTSIPLNVESMIFAMREQCINLKNYLKHTGRSQSDTVCRKCGGGIENVQHVLSACTLLAPFDYLHRHNAMLKNVYWWILRHYGEPIERKPWITHDQPKPLLERRGNFKISWDLPIHTSLITEHNKPDMVLVDFKKKRVFIIEGAVPFDLAVTKKELEKESRYKEVGVEMKHVYPGFQILYIVIVMGALGTISYTLQNQLQQLVEDEYERNQLIMDMQRAVLTESHLIMKRFLSLSIKSLSTSSPVATTTTLPTR